MQATVEFNFEKRIKEFEASVLSSPELTPRDCQDLTIHLLDLIDEYKAKGLDEEDAFLLALNKVGDKRAWDDGFKDANKGLIQVKRALGLFGGVFFYFLLYSLLLLVSKTTLYICGCFDVSTELLYVLNKFYFYFVYLFTILGILFMVMREEWFLKFLSKINLKPKQILVLFISIVVLAVAERIVHMTMKGLLTKDLKPYIRIEQTFIWFEYIFPILFSLGFIVLFIRYFKETKKQT